MTQTYFRNFGSIYLFFAKKLILLIILLPLDKILRFFVLLLTFVSTYVFNTESLNQDFLFDLKQL